MPNRVIRDDLLDSDRIRSLPTDSHRMLFVELLLLADDYGTAPANPALLERRAPSCHGKKHDVIAGLLDALAEQGLVVVYEVARNRYVFIPRFRNWPRGRKPRHPLPPEPFASQINELVKKRNADALQMHSTCSAHARETETETEKKDPSNVTITSQETSTKSVRAPKRAAFSLPPWVPEVSWNNFEEMRRKLRKPLTDAARAVNLRKLEQLRGQGHEPQAILDEAVANSWVGLWAPRHLADRSPRHSATGQHMAAVAREWLESKEKPK